MMRVSRKYKLSEVGFSSSFSFPFTTLLFHEIVTLSQTPNPLNHRSWSSFWIGFKIWHLFLRKSKNLIQKFVIYSSNKHHDFSLFLDLKSKLRIRFGFIVDIFDHLFRCASIPSTYPCQSVCGRHGGGHGGRHDGWHGDQHGGGHNFD